MPTTVHRRLATIALLATVAMTGVLVPSVAEAHGAPQNPVSRALACGPEGGSRKTMPACRAAIAAGGSLENWDSVRVPNVEGRDRTMIPDGKLCSGGIEQYRGLDLPRVDWPATNLTPGATYSFSYRATIAHRGTFRMYLSRSSYQPTRPLRWVDLDTAPFLTMTDPAFKSSAYVMSGQVPKGRTGRHLIYTIWQNSGSPDTYYSCSDVVFPAAGGAATAPPSAGVAEPTSANPTPTGTGAAGATSSNVVPSVAPIANSRHTAGGGLAVVAAVSIAVVAVGIALLALRRRRIRNRPGWR